MKKSILIAGTAIALAAQPLPAVLAQSGTPTPPTAEQPVQENQAQPQQNESTQAELGEQDRTFVEEASAGNMAELGAARLAEEKAESDAVKEYAAMLTEDHTQAGEELEQIAQEAGVTLATEIPQDAQQAQEKLAELSGAEFDQAFMEQMVTDHEKAVALYEKQASEGEHEALKQFASSTVDTLRTHLDQARQIERQMGEQPVAGTPGGTPSASQQESMAGSDAGSAEQPGAAATQQAQSGQAQSDPAQSAPAQSDPAADNPLMGMTAGDLIGKTVVNEQGDEVGEIEDIVIGTSDQSVQAVVSVGGFLGIGDKTVAMSFDELQPGQEEDSVLLSSGATVEELKQRPAYDEAGGYESYPADRPLGDREM
jgi:putative membrane protein